MGTQSSTTQGNPKETSLRNARIITPWSKKNKITGKSYMWYPNIDKDIENMVRSCLPCLSNRQNPPKNSFTPWKPETQAWMRVHADHLEVKKTNIFL